MPNHRLIRTIAAAAALSTAACRDAAGPTTERAANGRPPVSAARIGWVVTGVETIDLGTLPGGTQSIAYDINDAGVIVGESNYYPGGPVVPVRWTAPGVVSWLGSLGGVAGSARGINAGGGITGHSRLATGNYHAFFWTPALGMWDLGATPSEEPATSSIGRAISDLGMVVGNVDLAAKYWTGGSGWSNVFPTFRPALAYDVNGLHTIVGENLSLELAYVRRGTTITHLPSIAGTPYHNAALGINDAEVVVGRANAVASGYPRRHAFWWTEASGIHDIGTLAGGLESSAEDINEAGVIAGWSDAALDSIQIRRAFVWRSLMGMVSLPALGGASRRGEAYAINASNWVVGWSHTAAGQTHATLWKVSMRYEAPVLDYPIVYGGLTP